MQVHGISSRNESAQSQQGIRKVLTPNHKLACASQEVEPKRVVAVELESNIFVVTQSFRFRNLLSRIYYVIDDVGITSESVSYCNYSYGSKCDIPCKTSKLSAMRTHFDLRPKCLSNKYHSNGSSTGKPGKSVGKPMTLMFPIDTYKLLFM
jgi:hypothetical protein